MGSPSALLHPTFQPTWDSSLLYLLQTQWPAHEIASRKLHMIEAVTVSLASRTSLFTFVAHVVSSHLTSSRLYVLFVNKPPKRNKP